MKKIIGWVPIFGEDKSESEGCEAGCGFLFLLFIIIIAMNDIGCFNKSLWHSNGDQSLELAPSVEQRDN